MCCVSISGQQRGLEPGTKQGLGGVWLQGNVPCPPRHGLAKPARSEPGTFQSLPQTAMWDSSPSSSHPWLQPKPALGDAPRCWEWILG